MSVGPLRIQSVAQLADARSDRVGNGKDLLGLLIQQQLIWKFFSSERECGVPHGVDRPH